MIFKEFSCDHGEPITSGNLANPICLRNTKLAAEEPGFFVGRLASYKYFNMDLCS